MASYFFKFAEFPLSFSASLRSADNHYHKFLIYGCCSAVLHQPLSQAPHLWLLLRCFTSAITTSFSFLAVAPPSYISHYHKLLIYGCRSTVLHQPLQQVSRFWLLLRRLTSAFITSFSFLAVAPSFYISLYHKFLVSGCRSIVLHQPLSQVSHLWLLLHRFTSR